MKRMFAHVKLAALSAVVVSGVALAATQPALAGSMNIVSGQAYWRGDPGPVQPENFWVGGEYRYDPNHYLNHSRTEPVDFLDVVYADHAGSARCVWRKRVVNSNWEFEHPYLKVCRP